MMTDTTTPRAWDRLPDEDTLWYDRFCTYRDMGVTRSMAGAYRTWRMEQEDQSVDPSDYKHINYAPLNWYDTAKEWDWSARATAHDDYIREKWSNDDVLEKAKRRRVELLTQIAEKYGAELARRNPQDTPDNQVSSTMKTAARELREELGTGKSNVQFRVVLNNLPPEMQKALAEALDTDK